MSKFTESIHVINDVIQANRDEEPFKSLFGASQDLIGNQRIGVEVYKNDPANAHDFYTLKMVEGSLQIVEHGKSDPDFTWKVSEEYLEDVRQNPERYKENPGKLDLDWLKDRFSKFVG